jgi:hypothetical protein
MAQQIIEHYKTISIPVCLHEKEPLFLTVRDRRFKDWIFIAGGCRKREISNPIRCALRELEEETRGVVHLRAGEYSYFTFQTRNRTPAEKKVDISNNVDVVYIYHVFIFYLNLDDIDRTRMTKKFNEERVKTDQIRQLNMPFRRAYDENDKMVWDTLSNFSKKQQWETVNTHILSNPEFLKSVHSSNLLKFNTRQH